ncbi:MAG: hypothetical protein PHW03_05315 [Eubacteriales bacterium]|nr:hypothetical protein [Eubacteriales bacterium]
MEKITTNWKTSVCGIIAFAPQMLQVFGASIPEPVSNLILAVFGALGFFLAKDNNVTGGTVKQ